MANFFTACIFYKVKILLLCIRLNLVKFIQEFLELKRIYEIFNIHRNGCELLNKKLELLPKFNILKQKMKKQIYETEDK